MIEAVTLYCKVTSSSSSRQGCRRPLLEILSQQYRLFSDTI